VPAWIPPPVRCPPRGVSSSSKHVPCGLPRCAGADALITPALSSRDCLIHVTHDVTRFRPFQDCMLPTIEIKENQWEAEHMIRNSCVGAHCPTLKMSCELHCRLPLTEQADLAAKARIDLRPGALTTLGLVY
jgi:hypothetical protein